MRLVSALLVAVLAVGAAACGADPPKGPPQLAGELVPGGAFDPSVYRGKVTVVNFWGSWCAPCRAETPELIAAFEAVRASGVAFVGVDIRDPNRDQARAFIDAQKVPYPSIYDPQSRLALEFAVPPTVIPTTLILDTNGRVVQTFREPILRDQLADAVRAVH